MLPYNKYGLFRFRVAVDTNGLNYYLSSKTINELTVELIKNNWNIEKVSHVNGYALYDTTVADAINLAFALRDTNDVSFEAETQYGKTIILVLAKLFHTLWCETNRKDEVVIMVNPSRNAPDSQTREDEESARELHAAICFKGEKETIGNVLSNVVNNVIGSENNVVKRGGVAKAQKIIARALQANKKLVTLSIDEADEATSDTSQIYSWIKEFNKSNTDIKVRLLLCSATAYQFKFIDTFTHVNVTDLPKGCGYSGTFRGDITPVVSMSQVNRILGNGKEDRHLANFDLQHWVEAPDGGREDAQLILKTIRGFAKGINAPELGFNGKPFQGGQGMMIRFGTEDDINALLHFIRDDIEDDGFVIVDFYGKNPKLTNSKNVSQMIEKTRISELEARDEILPNDRAEVKRMASKIPYIVFVLGAGRRADRFPAHTTCFLDFTNRFSNSVSMEQGTVGRASGWGKITDSQSTMVMVSDSNAEMINSSRMYFNEFGIKFPIKGAGPNTIVIDDKNEVPTKIRRMKTSSVAAIKFDQFLDDPIIQSIRTDLENLIGPRAIWKTAATISGVKLGWPTDMKNDVIEPGYRSVRKGHGYQHYFDFWAMLRRDGRLEYLQSVLREKSSSNLTFLMPGEIGSGGWRYDVYDETHIRISINNIERSGHDKKGDQRDTAERKSKDGNNGPRRSAGNSGETRIPSTFWEKMDSDLPCVGGRLVSMSLTTTDEYDDYTGFLEDIRVVNSLPSLKSAYIHRASEEQQALVISTAAQKKSRPNKEFAE